MLWRHLCLVRAWSAAGLLGGLTLLSTSQATAQTPRAADPEPTTPPVALVTETVDLLKASKAGDLNIVARGQGQDRVRLTIRNTGKKRLNVVLPPGLVASAAAAQGRGLQSMGLGAVSNLPGAFGQFKGTGSQDGLRSVPVAGSQAAVTVPTQETLELTIPAVCLNYGLPTPTPKDVFTLVDVDDYTGDPRVRKALRSLHLYGTSQGVAQAVMWRVCNDLSFEEMASQAGKVMNQYEIALAARFVEALDASTGLDLVDASGLSQSRLFVRIQGEGVLAGDANRLNEQIERYRLLGLPVQSLEQGEVPSAAAPALFVKVTLTGAKVGETRGRIAVSYSAAPDQWTPLGKVSFQDTSSVAVLDGQSLARSLDEALASAFISVKPARRTVGDTNLKVVNRLPFTVSALTLKAGASAGAPSVPFDAVGIGPGRSVLLPIQAAGGSIERVELNGL